MGMDRTIRFASGTTPSWDTIRARLGQVGETGVLRMIDGLPAFPDEMPEPTWKELRVGLSAGMVTIRRGTDSLACVVWGNADSALQTAWNKLCWACAAGGMIETTSGALTAEEFAASVGLQPT